MTILKSAYKIPVISEEEIGYPIRQKVGRPHRVHRTNRKMWKPDKSIKLLREKGLI